MKRLAVFFVLIFFNLIIAQQSWKGKIEIKDGIEYIYNPEKGLWDDDQTKKLSLKRELSIGYYEGPEDYLFTHVGKISVDKKGNIYALDKDCVRVFNKSGEHLFTFGRKGQGPGEFEVPGDMVLDQDRNIYIRDANNQRISIFDSTGRSVTSIRINNQSFGQIAIKKNGEIFFSTMILYNREGTARQNNHLLRLYNPKGKLLNSFCESVLILKKGPYGRPKYSWIHFKLLRNENLVCVHNYPYKIQWFDQQNRLFRIIERDSPVFTKAKLVPTNFKTFDGKIRKAEAAAMRASIWNIFFLPDGKFFVYLKDNGPDYEKEFRKSGLGSQTGTMYLDLFDKNGCFLKSYPYDNFKYGKIKFIDADGYLYTNIGPEEIVPGVSKWRVTFE